MLSYDSVIDCPKILLLGLTNENEQQTLNDLSYKNKIKTDEKN